MGSMCPQNGPLGVGCWAATAAVCTGLAFASVPCTHIAAPPIRARVGFRTGVRVRTGKRVRVRVRARVGLGGRHSYPHKHAYQAGSSGMRFNEGKWEGDEAGAWRICCPRAPSSPGTSRIRVGPAATFGLNNSSYTYCYNLSSSGSSVGFQALPPTPYPLNPKPCACALNPKP